MTDQTGLSPKAKLLDDHVKKIMAEYNIKSHSEIELVFVGDKIWIEKDRKILGKKIKNK
jgi:hypothetical protein